MGILLAALTLGYAAWCLLLYVQQRSLVFPGTTLGPAKQLPSDAELWGRALPEGRVEALFWAAPRANGRHPAPVAVLAHGNFELATDLREVARAYNREGWHVLAPEYRGYGASAGQPSSRAITDDFEHFLEQALARADVAPPVVFHGRSLGSGILSELARRRRPDAVIHQSAFTAARDMARRYLVPGFLLRDRLDNVGFVRRYDGPVLVLHGERDEVIPFEHGRRLAKAAGTTVVRLECGHNDCLVHEGPTWERIRAFLRSTATK